PTCPPCAPPQITGWGIVYYGGVPVPRGRRRAVARPGIRSVAQARRRLGKMIPVTGSRPYSLARPSLARGRSPSRITSRRQHVLTTRGCQHTLTGMQSTLEIAEGAASNDPDVGLRAVAALRQLTERLEILQ